MWKRELPLNYTVVPSQAEKMPRLPSGGGGGRGEVEVGYGAGRRENPQAFFFNLTYLYIYSFQGGEEFGVTIVLQSQEMKTK